MFDDLDFTYHHELSILLDVVIASILAGIIGFEREAKEKPAGFRTNMIVGGVVALLVSVGDFLVQHYEDVLSEDSLRSDPLRMMEAIIVGVSFIGAGTILKSQSEEKIKYLTSAATLLFSAGIGITVSLKMYILAVGVTMLTLVINQIVKRVETKLTKDREKKHEKEE